MESLTIDCETDERTRRKLTPEEVTACKLAAENATGHEYLQRQKYEGAIGRLRTTQMGRDILVLLGIDE